MEELIKQLSEKVEGMKGSSVSKEELKAVQDELKGLKETGATAEAVTKLQEKLDDVAAKLLDFETKGESAMKSEGEQIHEFIVKNHDTIKNHLKSGSGFIEFEVKAVANITTATGVNTSPPAITGTQQAPLGNVNLRDMNIVGLTNNVNTSLAAYPYTEAEPKDGDYTFVAEGAAKPQIDFKWETRYATPYKIAAWMRLTEEAVQDVAGLESVANDYLRKKHDLKKNKAILFGLGTGGENKGATVYGRVFSAGPMALAVVNPNFMDVVNAAITDIATTHNYEDEVPYMPSLVMVNPVDFFLQLVSAKNADGLPLYPTASLFNQVVIGNMTIRPEESIPAGKIFVADMSKYNTTNYMPYTVKIGWINDDFIKNQFVILGESRFHAFVRRLDAQAFLYDDIATIKTAITAA